MKRNELIQNILKDYIVKESITTTPGELEAEQYVVDYFRSLEYFKAHPEYTGLYSIKDDPYHRSVSYGFVLGKSNRTVVLLHHNDVVTIEDFKHLKPYAFNLEELEKRFNDIATSSSKEVQDDYSSKEWLFGRGVCDMKGGGAIQMALLSEYSEKEMDGSVVVIAVPDEENLSSGMRAAIGLLKELKEQYHFDYKLMIDSESHQRKESSVGIVSIGSIGKIMPAITVRGFLAHAGMMFDGLNPARIMAEIVRNTEGNMYFSDHIGNEVAPAPTWLYLKDDKQAYNVSMPYSMFGCLSILTLNSSPKTILDKVKEIAEKSFADVLVSHNENYHQFLKYQNKEIKDTPWRVNVLDYATLLQTVKKENPEFEKLYKAKFNEVELLIKEGKLNYITGTSALTNFVLEYYKDPNPVVVIGLVPPYYPNVHLDLFKNKDAKVEQLVAHLQEYTKSAFQQNYDEEQYYTGISDLSYASVDDLTDLKNSLVDNMPFIQGSYQFAVDDMEIVKMPSINLGPWGKDLHKVTERVYKTDLFERTPQILDEVIQFILKK